MSRTTQTHEVLVIIIIWFVLVAVLYALAQITDRKEQDDEQ